MSLLTTFLKLFKWDTTDSEDLEQEFDIDKSLNDNWDKIEDFAEKANDVVIDIQDNIEDIKNKDTQQDKLIQKLQSNMINESTEEATSLYVADASDLPAVLTIEGNYYQETQEGTDNLAVLNEGTITQDGMTIDIQNGEATVSGKNTSEAITYIVIGTAYLYAGKKYYMRKENGSTGGGYSLLKSGKTIWFLDSGESSFIVSETGEYLIRFSVGAGGGPAGKFKLSIYETSGATWVQGKKTVPSLEYPSKIETVGDNINLLPNNAINKSENGVDFTVNSDKSIHVVGTATDNVSISLVGQYYDAQEVFRFKKNKQYKNVSNVDILYRKVDGDYVRIQKNTVFSYTEDVPVRYMYIQVDKGMTVDETYYPKIIEYYEGIDESYSQYNLGSLKIIKSNKNLFKITAKDTTQKGITYKVNDDGTVSATGTSQSTNLFIGEANLRPGTYTISGGPKNGGALAQRLSIYERIDETNQFIATIYGDDNYTYTTEKNVTIRLNYVMQGGITVDNEIVAPQVEPGEQATTFVKHEEKEYNLPIQKEMLLNDKFNLLNNKEMNSWNKIILNGTEDWQQSTSDNSVFFINIEDITTDINKFKLISNQYKYIGNIASVNSIPNNKICGFIANSTLQKRIILRNNNFTTLESFKASLVEKNMTLYYVSYTAAELDLTEEQKQVLNELNNLELFKGINNIYTEQDLALLQLNYTVDTKMYIDNKMANQNAESES